MNNRTPGQFTPTAAAQVADAKAWWAKNRPKAPGAIDEALDAALTLLIAEPDLGRLAEDVELRTVRRVHLTRIRHYLYYRVNQERQVVEVLALWHSARGTSANL